MQKIIKAGIKENQYVQARLEDFMAYPRACARRLPAS
jgi:hypothetical protein